MAPDKVNIREKFCLFGDYWNPRILGELNGQCVKAVKVKGAFEWHRDVAEDEMFLVTKGLLKMEFRDKVVNVAEGEFIIVPRMTEHRPVAEEETEILLFEPSTTVNTGNVLSERTRINLEKL